MIARVDRNKETGEFSCLVGGEVLAKGRSGAAISRLYDIEAAVNAGGIPSVKTRGHGDTREFDVCIGDYVLLEGQGAIKAYRNLDWLEKALPPVVEIRNVSWEESAGIRAGADDRAEMAAVPAPEMEGSIGLAAVFETDDGKGNRFEEQHLLSGEPLADEAQP